MWTMFALLEKLFVNKMNAVIFQKKKFLNHPSKEEKKIEEN